MIDRAGRDLSADVSPRTPAGRITSLPAGAARGRGQGTGKAGGVSVRPEPCSPLHVANGRLRHMLISYAHVSKTDDSQLLGPAARRLRASTTRPTSTTTSFPASATTGRDSTAACAPARLGRNLAHLVNTVVTWSQNKVEAAYARSDLFDRRGASDGGLGCLPHPATRTASMPESRLANLMAKLGPGGSGSVGRTTGAVLKIPTSIREECESLKRAYDLLARVAQALGKEVEGEPLDDRKETARANSTLSVG